MLEWYFYEVLEKGIENTFLFPSLAANEKEMRNKNHQVYEKSTLKTTCRVFNAGYLFY